MRKVGNHFNSIFQGGAAGWCLVSVLSFLQESLSGLESISSLNKLLPFSLLSLLVCFLKDVFLDPVIFTIHNLSSRVQLTILQ